MYKNTNSSLASYAPSARVLEEARVALQRQERLERQGLMLLFLLFAFALFHVLPLCYLLSAGDS